MQVHPEISKSNQQHSKIPFLSVILSPFHPQTYQFHLLKCHFYLYQPHPSLPPKIHYFLIQCRKNINLIVFTTLQDFFLLHKIWFLTCHSELGQNIQSQYFLAGKNFKATAFRPALGEYAPWFSTSQLLVSLDVPFPTCEKCSQPTGWAGRLGWWLERHKDRPQSLVAQQKDTCRFYLG